MSDTSFKDFILDQLESLGDIRIRAMFGGYGIYQGDIFFGIIHKDRLYFKTDENTRQDYLEQGMKPFQPNSKQTLKTYYEVPAEIIEDSEELTVWAKRAVSANK